jgi:hypothetical protein
MVKIGWLIEVNRMSIHTNGMVISPSTSFLKDSRLKKALNAVV